MQKAGLAQHPSAFHTLARLQQAVHDDGLISYYLEDGQDLDKVLDIFVRVNSGGTVLSKSDLLLSVTTAQFTTLDARDEVHGLVDDLTAVGHGFNFSKDLVLKTGLILSGVSDVGFKVQNFNTRNIALLEASWPEIERALRLGVKSLSSFGFAGSTLKANSVLIPIAHYLHSRKHADAYLTQSAWREDRESLRHWTVRSLGKPGIWGSGLDTLLNGLRSAIDTTTRAFPVDALEAAMVRQGNSLAIGDALLDELAEIFYRDKRLIAVLALLYPGVDVRNQFHIDHVFPKSLFTEARLEAAGVSKDLHEEYRSRFDGLPTLQLLEGPENEGKRNRLPADWARDSFANPVAPDGWLASHDLHDLPVDIDGFLEFYKARRHRMRRRLEGLLVVSRPTATSNDEPSLVPPHARLAADSAERSPRVGEATFLVAEPEVVRCPKTEPSSSPRIFPPSSQRPGRKRRCWLDKTMASVCV